MKMGNVTKLQPLILEELLSDIIYEISRVDHIIYLAIKWNSPF